MAANFSGGLIGLSLLTGGNALGRAMLAMPFESRAVREAKALFTTPDAIAPWQEPQPETPVSSQVAMIKRLASIIDKPTRRDEEISPDVRAAFTTYKALDRLRVLAEFASQKTTSSSARASMADAFAEGLADLQTYLASTPTDQLRLAFTTPSRRAQTVAIASSMAMRTPGAGILADRYAAIPGIAGNEVLKLTLGKFGETDKVIVDLAQTSQPPTLDSIADALNGAIAGIPLRDANGVVMLDTSGNPIPKYQARFAVDKGTGQWGLALDAVSSESVSLDQVGAKDALMVATGQTAAGAAATTSIIRFDDPASAFAHKTLGTIAAIDREATELAKADAGDGEEPAEVQAPTTTRAIVTAPDGSSYVVGTTSGDLGSNISDGSEDLFLTKLDSEGQIVWQRTLGASGSAEGVAITLAPDGDIVVAGTVRGSFNGSSGADSDMLVVRFDANGDEQFAKTIRTVGDDQASAVAVGADGSIYVGGRSASAGGDAFVARLSATGLVQERRSIDSGGSDSVTALAIDGNGELLALTRENGTAQLRRLDAQALATDLGSVSLGSADARALAVSATGEIAVAGAARGSVPGAQINSIAGERDGFVARIDAGLSGASISYIGSGADDQADSVAFMGGDIYVGGRTTGVLSGTRTGSTDGFVSRVDAATGAIESTTQFGQPTLKAEPVRVSAAVGGAGITGLLGLHRSTLNPAASTKLVAQTTLRAGDEFAIRVDGGAVRKVTIGADETLSSLAARIRTIAGAKAAVTTPRSGEGNVLRIEPKAGHSIEFIAGAEGRDGLAKLGLEPARITVPPPLDEDAPTVQPGGAYGLDLRTTLGIGTAEAAGAALEALKSALSMTQTAFRSLYWDDMKAARVDGFVHGGGSPYQQAQLAKYQDALARISSITGFY